MTDRTGEALDLIRQYVRERSYPAVQEVTARDLQSLLNEHLDLVLSEDEVVDLFNKAMRQ